MAYPFRNENPVKAVAWGTWSLLLACTLVFAFAQPKAMQGLTHGLTVADNASAELEVQRFQDEWALVPCEVTHGRSIFDGAACDGYPVDQPGTYVEKNVWVPFLTAQFLHANILHLLGNLLFLWVFGKVLEERVHGAAVIGLFLAGGVAAFLGYVALVPESATPVLGASGAVAAIMGAVLVLQPRRRLLSFVYAAGTQIVYLPAWALLAFFGVSQFFTTPGTQVAWQAHVVGMAFGMAVAGVWWWRDPSLAGTRTTDRRDTTFESDDATRSDRPAATPADSWPTTPPRNPPASPREPLNGPRDGEPVAVPRG